MLPTLIYDIWRLDAYSHVAIANFDLKTSRGVWWNENSAKFPSKHARRPAALLPSTSRDAPRLDPNVTPWCPEVTPTSTLKFYYVLRLFRGFKRRKTTSKSCPIRPWKVKVNQSRNYVLRSTEWTLVKSIVSTLMVWNQWCQLFLSLYLKFIVRIVLCTQDYSRLSTVVRVRLQNQEYTKFQD